MSATIVLGTARRIIEKREILEKKDIEDRHIRHKIFIHMQLSGANKYKDQNVCSIAGHGIPKSDIQHFKHFSLVLVCSRKYTSGLIPHNFSMPYSV